MPHSRFHRIRRQKHTSPLKTFKKRLLSLNSLKKIRRRVYFRAKSSKKRSSYGFGLIFLAILLFSFPTLYKKFISRKPQTPNSTASTQAKLVKKDSNTASEPIRVDSKLLEGKEALQPPLRMVIPTISIDLPVVEANVVNGYWELSDTTASHGVGSANPGESGNTVIFAHAREGLFLPLKNIKKDNLIYILTKDRWYRYKVVDIKFVDPNQIEVISPTTDETLTLYTCSGFLDSKRLIVTAKPQRP